MNIKIHWEGTKKKVSLLSRDFHLSSRRLFFEEKTHLEPIILLFQKYELLDKIWTFGGFNICFLRTNKKCRRKKGGHL